MASLSSAKPSCSPSNALPDAEAARPRWDESRREEREDARRGVVGRDRGDLLRVRRYDGVVVGVVEAMCVQQYVLTPRTQCNRRPIAVSTRCTLSVTRVLKRGLSSGLRRSKQYPTTQGKYAKTNWSMMPWPLLPKLHLPVRFLVYRIQQTTIGRDFQRLTSRRPAAVSNT
jgi:hypothetical protein